MPEPIVSMDEIRRRAEGAVKAAIAGYTPPNPYPTSSAAAAAWDSHFARCLILGVDEPGSQYE